MIKLSKSFLQVALFVALLAGRHHSAQSQQSLSLSDLSGFVKPANNWKIVGDASADLYQENVLHTKPGTGVLACVHPKGQYGGQYDLVSQFQHGDLDIELDFMLAKGSNSGIYLQGNYEVQLFDSWGKKQVRFGDNAGIYERWDDAKPEGQKGYEGYAPRYNVSKAPGLWQHIRISYQAPKFDADGKKIANAIFLQIVLNGTIVHENLEVSGPTRGALTSEDVALGPLRIQGDHGSLAIRNIVFNNFDKKAGTLSKLNYKVYYGGLKETDDFSKHKPNETGTTDALTWDVSKENNNYSIFFDGKYNAPADGEYVFKLQAAGNNYLKIDGKTVLGPHWKQTHEVTTAKVTLTAGEHTIELFNNKRDGWLRPGLGLWVSGPGFREVAFHSKASSIPGKSTDPILIKADNNTVVRSFMDFKPGQTTPRRRVVHAVSVGTPSGLHYTYDLDKGTVFQVWRGGFLDATPMWHDRGDGSSRPSGSLTVLGDAPAIGLAGTSPWPADTTGSGYQPKGYTVDDEDLPTFVYKMFGGTVSDRILPVKNDYFERTIKVTGASKSLEVKVADGVSVEKMADGLYAVNDKSYYIQLEDKSLKAEIRKTAETTELIVPLTNGELKYGILF